MNNNCDCEDHCCEDHCCEDHCCEGCEEEGVRISELTCFDLLDMLKNLLAVPNEKDKSFFELKIIFRSKIKSQIVLGYKEMKEELQKEFQDLVFNLLTNESDYKRIHCAKMISFLVEFPYDTLIETLLKEKKWNFNGDSENEVFFSPSSSSSCLDSFFVLIGYLSSRRDVEIPFSSLITNVDNLQKKGFLTFVSQENFFDSETMSRLINSSFFYYFLEGLSGIFEQSNPKEKEIIKNFILKFQFFPSPEKREKFIHPGSIKNDNDILSILFLFYLDFFDVQNKIKAEEEEKEKGKEENSSSTLLTFDEEKVVFRNCFALMSRYNLKVGNFPLLVGIVMHFVFGPEEEETIKEKEGIEKISNFLKEEMSRKGENFYKVLLTYFEKSKENGEMEENLKLYLELSNILSVFCSFFEENGMDREREPWVEPIWDLTKDLLMLVDNLEMVDGEENGEEDKEGDVC